jgi:hypothetical protein
MAKTQPPNGSSKQYIIQCDKPGLKFTYEASSPAWLALKEDEENNRLRRRFPYIQDPTASGVMTTAMLEDITHQFDEYGEFITGDKQLAIAAYNAARGSDYFARLQTTSLPIEDKFLREIKPHEIGYYRPS